LFPDVRSRASGKAKAMAKSFNGLAMDAGVLAIQDTHGGPSDLASRHPQLAEL
jgi:hypothetical protein